MLLIYFYLPNIQTLNCFHPPPLHILSKVDPHGAQTEVLKIAENLGFAITVALAFEIHPSESESESESGTDIMRLDCLATLVNGNIVHWLSINYC